MALVKGTNCGFVTAAPHADPYGDDYVCDAVAVAFKDTAPEGAVKVVEIGWYCDNATEESNFEVAIYDHNTDDNNPEAVVGWDQTNAKGTGSGWKRCTGLDIAITAGSTYWLAMQLDNVDTPTNINLAADAGEKVDVDGAVAALKDPWGVSDASYGQLASIYAIYTMLQPEGNKSCGSLSKDLSAQDRPPGLWE